ncbi:MAG TPA: serine/threonine-protein kinase, partial [Thermoanaerobaculia bacterium]
METALRSGAAISHYRILGRLGSGGMGDVYRAHDTSLDRGIALKILPPDLVKNEDRVRRFIQEARSASSLSHPNIVTIHEIGQAEVNSDDGEETTSSVYYIAMELIEGETLRKKFQQEILLKTLLGYLVQASEGLAKAHAAGIVHRDLKPENIMVSGDGFTKVLDFGLAKLSERKPQIPSDTDAPTAVRDETREGIVLGTVGYMSPEQVQGKPFDHRSDIFSFGCILYEATTGRKPFAADSDIETLHKILHDKPPAIDGFNAAAPAELRRMIRRCLAKDPDKRYQSMKDLAIELDELVEEFDELSVVSTSRGPDSSLSAPRVFVPPRRSAISIWVVSGLTLLIGIAGIIFGLLQMRKAASKSQASAFESMRL